MASRRPHLKLIHAADLGAPACRSPDVGSRAAAAGLCASCLAVYATAEVLYRRLVARDMARLERRTPGLGRAALAALQTRLATLGPVDRSGPRRRASQWMPEEWELDRLDAFLAELRGGRPAPAGEGA